MDAGDILDIRHVFACFRDRSDEFTAVIFVTQDLSDVRACPEKLVCTRWEEYPTNLREGMSFEGLG
jgi:hypothetical protein